MKQENHDINVVEQVSIPKFSKLDNIGTPLRLFELFFDDALVQLFLDDALVDMIVVYTKLYSHREKADTSFEINKEAFRLSEACYSLVGVISFQTV